MINGGQFYWFLGEIVDVNDPEEKGRVKVKSYTQQNTNKESVNDADLNWAVVAQSLVAAASKGNSFSPHGLQKGSQVFGFYIDGKMMQVPFVICTFNTSTDNQIDLHELTRGVNKFNDGSVEFEPKNPYNAKYPHNKVYHTSSGHVVEIDDTPNSERLHIRHKNGSYYHFFPDGTVVRKSVNDTVDLTINDSKIFIGGDCTEHIKGDYNLIIDGKYKIEANAIDVTSKTSVSYNVATSYNVNSKYSINLKSSILVKLNGGVIQLN